MASGNLSVNLTPLKNDRALIEISNAVQSTFEIEIKNMNGEVVFYKQTPTPAENYKKLYNFSELEDGSYNFTVRIDNEIIQKKLKMENGMVHVLSIEKELTPFVSFDNNQLKLSYLNFDQKDVILYVYNTRNNEEIYKGDLGKAFSINHGLDLSKLENGSYEAILVSENHIHPYDINIE